MSIWRKEAFERFPEFRKQLQENKSPYGFFRELIEQLNAAIENKNESVTRRIYDYAKWCYDTAPRGKSAEDDIFTTVVVSFYESLPLFPVIFKEMHRRLPKSRVIDLRGPLLYHGSEAAYEELLSRYEQKGKNRA